MGSRAARVSATILAQALLVLAACLAGCGSSGTAQPDGGGDASSGGDGRVETEADAATSDASSADAVVDGSVGCRATTECASSAMSNVVCIGGTIPSGCGGAVYPSDCQTDGDCRRDGGARVCTKLVCADAGSCGCVGRQTCVEPTCATDLDCHDPNQTCQDGLCGAKPCTSDGACTGFCVNGVCSAALGSCGVQQLVP